MALGFLEALRHSRLAEISTLLDAGATGAEIRIFDGTRPATGAGIGGSTLLAIATMSTTSFAAPTGGTMTANAISPDVSIDATGTASWFRAVDSDSTFVLDGDVGTSGTDMIVNSVSFTSGAQFDVTSWVITGGNP